MRICWLFFALQILVLVGCGAFEQHKETEPKSASELEQLKAKVPEVKKHFLAVSNPSNHWPDAMDCDGVLHAGVARAAGVKEVNISLADYPDGSIGRRPVTAPPCWTEAEGDKGSKSTTSGDMAQGRILAFWRDRDLAGVQKFASYGEANQIEILGLPAWILGEPYPEQEGRLLLRPGMVGVVGRVIEALSGGSDLRPYRGTPSVFSAGGEDYQEALTVRGIVLFGEVDAGLGGGDAVKPSEEVKPELPPEASALLSVDGEMYKVLKTLAEQRPDDPLFQAAYARYSGDYAPAYRVLLGELHCPTYTRDSEPNCLANWLFAASLIVGSVEGF